MSSRQSDRPRTWRPPPHELSAAARGYDHRWTAISRAWRAEFPYCGMRADGGFHGEHSACARLGQKAFAELVDHIRPIADGGEIFDRANLQSLCRACHGLKTDLERAHPRRWVICGPPGSGKSTWVNAQRRPGDLVWDADAIAAVLAQCPEYPRPAHVIGVVLELRDALIRRIAANPLLSCYVIITDVGEAAHVAARLGASIKTLDAAPALV